MKRRTNILLYLLLNIVVSAATTLGVLFAWDRYFKAEFDRLSGGAPAPTAMAALVTQAPQQAAPGQPVTHTPPAVGQPPAAAATLPPPDQQVIQILSVVGAGDLQQEVVLLKRLGQGNLPMVGWKLVGEDGATYTFPAQPELTLFMDGAVQVFSKAGEDSATEVYWNRSEPAWTSGKVIRLLDYQGNERATYRVP